MKHFFTIALMLKNSN